MLHASCLRFETFLENWRSLNRVRFSQVLLLYFTFAINISMDIYTKLNFGMFILCIRVFLLFVHVFLTLPMYSYCCLCILIVRPCILDVVHVFLLLSM